MPIMKHFPYILEVHVSTTACLPVQPDRFLSAASSGQSALSPRPPERQMPRHPVAGIKTIIASCACKMRMLRTAHWPMEKNHS